MVFLTISGQLYQWTADSVDRAFDYIKAELEKRADNQPWECWLERKDATSTDKTIWVPWFEGSVVLTARLRACFPLISPEG